MPDPDPTPTPPDAPNIMPPLGMAQIVPSTAIVTYGPDDTGAMRVVLRTESLNGSHILGWSPDEARRIAGILINQSNAADRAAGPKIEVPTHLDADTLDRLRVPGQ